MRTPGLLLFLLGACTDTPYVQWLAAGPGYVLSDYGELVSYTP